jgi:hypothetical protein
MQAYALVIFCPTKVLQSVGFIVARLPSNRIFVFKGTVSRDGFGFYEWLFLRYHFKIFLGAPMIL